MKEEKISKLEEHVQKLIKRSKSHEDEMNKEIAKSMYLEDKCKQCEKYYQKELAKI
jgi:hypothetical protein